VDDSTVCSETEHCSSGAGGELSYLLYLDVAGAQIELGLHGCPNQLDVAKWAYEQ
jgi:hypothetical protein